MPLGICVLVLFLPTLTLSLDFILTNEALASKLHSEAVATGPIPGALPGTELRDM